MICLSLFNRRLSNKFVVLQSNTFARYDWIPTLIICNNLIGFFSGNSFSSIIRKNIRFNLYPQLTQLYTSYQVAFRTGACRCLCIFRLEGTFHIHFKEICFILWRTNRFPIFPFCTIGAICCLDLFRSFAVFHNEQLVPLSYQIQNVSIEGLVLIIIN